MRRTATITCIALLSACQTHPIPPNADGSAVHLAELRARAAYGNALIKRSDREEWSRGRIIHVGPDSLRWQDEVGRAYALFRDDVEAVRFERRKAATVTWAAIGLSAGALIGASVSDDDEWWRGTDVYLGAATGGAAGIALGMTYGLPVTYRFRAP